MAKRGKRIINLTLTSVVFELNKWNLKGIFVKNLTLTSVVFEFNDCKIFIFIRYI